MGLIRSHGFAWFLAITGYILSPLSWWNDLFVNVPLAYLFAAPFSLLHESLYLPAFVLGYWLSNLLGLVLLHRGGATLLKKKKVSSSWRSSMVITLIYTSLIAALVLSGVLPSVSELTGYVEQN